MVPRSPRRFDLPGLSHAREHWRHRIRTDFRLGIISLFCVCSVTAILPLAVYRFIVGDWQTGIGDLALVSLFIMIVVHAWRSGDTQLAARLLALTMTLGYLALVIFGSVHVMWAFPILGAGFLLADRVFASLSGLATLSLSAAFSGRFDNAVDIWSFVTTGVLVALFGLIFATRTEMQRRQLDDIASRDPLTQAGNRRALRQILELVERDQDKRGEPASVVLLDLDHFKSVNDAYGHKEGDRILVNFVDIVTARLRDGDTLFRLGGEEFVVVLPATELDSAMSVADQLRAHVAEQLEGPGGPVTVSMGVAELEAGEALREWLSRADEALYRAKHRGRNRVEAAERVAG
jgi:diguanylate cyclase (GGDEF)-like protein